MESIDILLHIIASRSEFCLYSNPVAENYNTMGTYMTAESDRSRCSFILKSKISDRPSHTTYLLVWFQFSSIVRKPRVSDWAGPGHTGTEDNIYL